MTCYVQTHLKKISIHNRSHNLFQTIWLGPTRTETDTQLCLSVPGFENKKLPRRHSSTSAQTARDILRRLRDLLMYVATKLTPVLPKEAEIVEKRVPTPVLMLCGI